MCWFQHIVAWSTSRSENKYFFAQLSKLAPEKGCYLIKILDIKPTFRIFLFYYTNCAGYDLHHMKILLSYKASSSPCARSLTYCQIDLGDVTGMNPGH